ncbi:MAG: hypothetical protein ACRC8A_21255 [Microcoleaceae cyanobacterium]
MPSQVLMPTYSVTRVQSSSSEGTNPYRQGDRPTLPDFDSDVRKSPYTVDQQVKFLHLQAEVDTLLMQLQSLQRQC